MYNISIKTIKDEQDTVVKAKIIKKNVSKNYKSTLIVKIGETYIVKPLNPNKLKHRNRKIQIVKFNSNERYGLRVNVKFLDNNRAGIVDIDDLEAVVE